MTIFTPRPQWIVDLINELAGTGGGTWGAISGTLSNQTDLQAALNAKASTSHSHIISDVTGLQTALDNKVDDSQVSAFGGTLIDDADAAAARTTLGLGFSGCLAKLGSDLTTINASSGYLVPFNSEEYDTGTFHDNVTNNTRITIPSGVSRIKLYGSASLALVSANSLTALQFYKNGASFLGSTPVTFSTAAATPQASIASPILSVSSGDYFELRLFCADASISVLSDMTVFGAEVIL